MKTIVCVLSFNPLSNLRFELLKRTLASIDAAFPSSLKAVFDNGSTDGSSDAVLQELSLRSDNWAFFSRGAAENTTPGAGRNWVLSEVWQMGPPRPDLVVFSDDDMLWKENSQATLERFWSEPPDDVAIVSGLLEDVWHWNKPIEAIEANGVRVLVRESAPAAGWTFRSTGCGIAKMMQTGAEPFLADFGEDYDLCQRLIAEGNKVAQIDLAEHIGWGYSTHGNEADRHVGGRSLDREKWGV